MNDFWIKYEKIIPLLLFILFMAVSVPGISWGTPDIWNPDELVGRVDLALGGELIFDETEPDFNYPSLPKYVMYGIGKVVYGLGYSRAEFIISARCFSALLGGSAVVLIYFLACRMGAGIPAAALSGLLMITSSVIPYNARFGHNDMYLQLFVVLCVYSLVNFQYSQKRMWLYSSFFMVGLAASSKYTGGSLLLLPIIVLFFVNWPEVRKDILATSEKLFIGLCLSVLGYASGTPKALLWTAYYVKRVFPALIRYPVYGLQPDSSIGLIGQWHVFQDAVGIFIYYLFLAALIWWVSRLAFYHPWRVQLPEDKKKNLLIVMFALLLFDLPFLISVNYIPRYFIPFVPCLALLTAFFLEELVMVSRDKGYPFVVPLVSIILLAGLAYSLMRVMSTTLLFVNDPRTPAGEYLKTLRPETVIEYTLYPPIIPQGHFSKTRNYPIFLLKYPGDTVPTNKSYAYNVGEAGLIERGVDYLVVDSFTYGRFTNTYVCNSNPVECEFFSKLLSGDTTFYLLRIFTYKLPSYMPKVSVAAVNPEVRIYERIR